MHYRAQEGKVVYSSKTGKDTKMRIISFIENGEVIREILKHLGIWLVRSRPPPKIHAPPILLEPEYADPLPLPHPDTDCYADPDDSWDEYIQS